MRLTALFRRARLPKSAQATNLQENQQLARSGSWFGFIAAAIASACLIFAAGAQNVAHAYGLGIASSEFKALVLAVASAGASILAPFCWLAVVRGRGLGTRFIALILALGCLGYAGVCSLGFVAGSRSEAVSERQVVSDRYADRRALAAAAKAELATLKGQTKAVIERRRELTRILADSGSGVQKAAPVQADAQAGAVAFYMRAAGWQVSDADVGVWLTLGMVIFLELAAALSLTVAASLKPMPRRSAAQAPPAAALPAEAPAPAEPAQAPVRPSKAAAEREDDDDQPKPPRLRGKGGRPRDVIPAEAIERLRAKGGRMTGTVNGIGKVLGSRSKTAAHRMLHELAAAGLIRMTVGQRGVAVALA